MMTTTPHIDDACIHGTEGAARDPRLCSVCMAGGVRIDKKPAKRVDRYGLGLALAFLSGLGCASFPSTAKLSACTRGDPDLEFMRQNPSALAEFVAELEAERQILMAAIKAGDLPPAASADATLRAALLTHRILACIAL